MTTLATTEPCGSCLCCQAGRRCARVLLIGAKDEAKLRRVFDVIGAEPSGRTIHTKTATERARRADPPEPTTAARCPRCREDYELFTYIAEALQAGRFPTPPCEPCRYAGKERADLA